MDGANKSRRNYQICCCIVTEYVEKVLYDSGNSHRNYNNNLTMG